MSKSDMSNSMLDVSNSESNSHLAHIYYFISVSSMYESNPFQVDVSICESDSLSDHMDCFVSVEKWSRCQ